jgi:hypothetical protein
MRIERQPVPKNDHSVLAGTSANAEYLPLDKLPTQIFEGQKLFMA